jgi:hypothetical protein
MPPERGDGDPGEAPAGSEADERRFVRDMMDRAGVVVVLRRIMRLVVS